MSAEEDDLSMKIVHGTTLIHSDCHCADETTPRARILVVENTPSIADMLCWTLELSGYCPIAYTGRQGQLAWIESFIRSEDPPGLILLDLSISSCNDGVTFLQQLRQLWLTAHAVPPPMIVLTTSKQVYEGLTRVERVIQKPFHIRELLAEVQKVLPAHT